MSNINILFYSNNCPGSQKLISLMQQEGLLRFFHQICTDNNVKIPPQIRLTPTLIIRGVPTPYVAKDAFEWLARIKQWKMQLLMQKVSNEQQEYLKNINNNLGSDNQKLLEFSQAEMAGMSDIFAYLANENAAPHTYVPYQDLGQDNIFTPPLEDGQYKVSQHAKYKIPANKQKELNSKLLKERKEQDEMFKREIDKFKKAYQQKN